MKLNDAQQEAVDHIFGPLLVLAGPGTGKTQLLSARIANILQKTDTVAENTLCLTFTEAAAQNMRERLASIIKDDAYDVHINTYHGFGSDIIRSYPEYFDTIDLETGQDSRLEQPIDDLMRLQFVTECVNALPFSSPLIGAKHYIKHVSGTISELKRSIYTPQKLRELAADNLKTMQKISPKIAEILSTTKRFPSKAETAIELFSHILALLDEPSSNSTKDGYLRLNDVAYDTLTEALSEASDTGKSKPLTAWKNAWLTKDAHDQFQLTNELQHTRMRELAGIYEQYQKKLIEKNLYDFDDMILRTIETIEANDELRFTLQERYQFILLDEFQDTNATQFKLVQLLADNPVNEGQPNIFAVGDDDQAIYAFQGAQLSNMLKFTASFRDVAVINLTENYRSHDDIIKTAHAIADQIDTRLHHTLAGITKTLVASAGNLPKKASIERHELSGEANEYAWVASKIKQLIDNGTSPSELAVLAPKHALLEKLVPFLAAKSIPVQYEKREDILSTPLLRALRTMAEAVVAAQAGDELRLQMLLPQVLSLEFYNIPVRDIWQLNWQKDKDQNWIELALQSETIAPHVLFYLSLGLKNSAEPLEYMLDYLVGSCPLKLDADTEYTSPLKSYYFEQKQADPLKFYELITHLTTIREHIRAHQTGQEKLLTVTDFLAFIAAYEQADQPLINSHPIAQAQESIQLMTAYKAKGLEFEHVFLISMHDDVWGKKARSNANKLSLPANLRHIRYQGSSEDELRRLLFVAATRAKYGLYLSSHAKKDSGKQTEPVKYLLEYANETGDRHTTILPEHARNVQQTDYTDTETLRHIDMLWHSRHVSLDTELKHLLLPRLEKYQMSPTHLNSFIDMEYGGPETFLLQTILRFPQAPTEDGEFGNAVHSTLDWYQKQLAEGRSPDVAHILAEFDRQLKKRYLAQQRIEDLQARGRAALEKYLLSRETMFQTTAKSEVDFRSEGVLVDAAHLSGKIDRLEILSDQKAIRIVDFKTGSPHTKWDKTLKLLKYKQQLYFYKFLIEGSHTWRNYTVVDARLEFVEPDENGAIVPPLIVTFDANEEREMKQLIARVWHMITTLELPDTSQYKSDYSGSNSFIQDLLAEV